MQKDRSGSVHQAYGDLPELSAFEPACADEAKAVREHLRATHPEVLVAEVQKAKGTASSAVYLVRNGARLFVFKATDWFTVEGNNTRLRDVMQSLERVYAVSACLSDLGSPVIGAVSGKDGLRVSLFGRLPAVLMPYVVGLPMLNTLEGCVNYGRALGLFHRCGEGCLSTDPGDRIVVEGPYEVNRTIYAERLRADLLRGHACKVPQVCRTVRDAIPLLDGCMAFVDGSGVNAIDRPRGWLHNDLNPGNLMFDGKGSCVAVIDVDQASVGPFIWDLGNSLMSLCTRFSSADTSIDLAPYAAAMLRGYHGEHPLPLIEYELLLAATQRWDVMRILRSLQRHWYGGDRLPQLLPKLPTRLIPRLRSAQQTFSFITSEWIQQILT